MKRQKYNYNKATLPISPGPLTQEGGGASGRETASDPVTENEHTLDCSYEHDYSLSYGLNRKTGMAESVTRHASTPLVTQFTYLLSGIDTLDVGLYVTWGSDWQRRVHTLDKKKQEARKKGGLLVSMPSGRTCIFRPGGKGDVYRFHLQFEAYNLYIAKAAHPKKTPNVYLSINAKTLWLDGIEKALSWIAEDLAVIGRGKILFVQISRLDVCTDFFIPGGLSYDFLLSHKATRTEKGNLYLDSTTLETYYVGKEKSPTQLRIYNKGLEVRKGGNKLWFLDLWKRESTEDIWRIEFQLRRPALKKRGINALSDLQEKQGGLWCYLTSEWFSLRLQNNEKTERRTTHPLWRAVQECFTNGIHQEPLKPIPQQTVPVSPDWYLSHIDGCLSSFAAHLGITNREDALKELQDRLNSRNNERDFQESCIKKAIQKGTLSDGGDQ